MTATANDPERQGVVLLHGFGGGEGSFSEVTDLLAESSAAVDCFAPVLLGHHPTRCDELDGTFEDEVDRVVTSIAERFGDTPCVRLVGYSLGGRVALGVLKRAPDRFASALLIGANPGLDRDDDRRERVAGDERWAELAERAGAAGFFEEWMAQPLFASQAALPGARLESQARIRERHSGAGLAGAMRNLSLGRMPNYWPDLEALEIPVTIVVGEKDAKFKALGERMARALRSSELVVVPGASHNCVLEAPEAIVAALLAQMEVS